MTNDTPFRLTQDQIDDLARIGIRLVASIPFPQALADESTLLEELAAFLANVRPYIHTRFGHDIPDSKHVKGLRVQVDKFVARIGQARENERRLFPLEDE